MVKPLMGYIRTISLAQKLTYKGVYQNKAHTIVCNLGFRNVCYMYTLQSLYTFSVLNCIQ